MSDTPPPTATAERRRIPSVLLSKGKPAARSLIRGEHPARLSAGQCGGVQFSPAATAAIHHLTFATLRGRKPDLTDFPENGNRDLVSGPPALTGPRPRLSLAAAHQRGFAADQMPSRLSRRLWEPGVSRANNIIINSKNNRKTPPTPHPLPPPPPPPQMHSVIPHS